VLACATWAVHAGWGPALGLVGATLVYAPLDFRCQAMMGDAGSNLLGSALGTCWASHLHPAVQGVVLAALLALHAYAERHSLTDAIARRAPLRWLDELGVKRT